MAEIEKPGHNHGFDDPCPAYCPGNPLIERGDFGMPTIGGGVGKIVPMDHSWIIALDEAPQTDDARWILDELMPELLGKFLRKNAQYARAQTGHDLGIKGIIPDINRKSSAIITRVWDEVVPHQNVDEVEDLLDDLIGHCLLMRAKLRDA